MMVGEGLLFYPACIGRIVGGVRVNIKKKTNIKRSLSASLIKFYGILIFIQII